MASPHVPVTRALRVPTEFAEVEGLLQLHDPDLRVRKSVELPGWFVVERRCRRRSPVHTGMRDGSDIHVQARDGYIHVATAHPSWLRRPWNIVRELKQSGVDTFAEGAMRIADDLEYEERFAAETKRRRFKENNRARARELFDQLDRQGNRDGSERTRISNPGLPGRVQ